MRNSCDCPAGPHDYVNKVLDHIEELWISIAEVRQVLRIPEGRGQDDEWLAYCCISWTRVHDVFPYDGHILHCTRNDYPVISEGARFDWASGSWYCTVFEERLKVFQKWMRGILSK